MNVSQRGMIRTLTLSGTVSLFHTHTNTQTLTHTHTYTTHTPTHPYTHMNTHTHTHTNTHTHTQTHTHTHIHTHIRPGTAQTGSKNISPCNLPGNGKVSPDTPLRSAVSISSVPFTRFLSLCCARARASPVSLTLSLAQSYADARKVFVFLPRTHPPILKTRFLRLSCPHLVRTCERA